MFDEFDMSGSSYQKDKIVKLQRNGNASLMSELKLEKGLKFEKIFKQICDKMDIANAKKMRLFNDEGVEINEDDLQYVKNGSTLYVSKGEDFDQASKFSEYENIKLLGQGGFGTVMLGKHRKTQELVAIKTVNTGMIGNAMDIDMVFKEVQMLKSMNHKNIVKVINCYTLGNMQVVIIMEYLHGGEMLEFVQKKGRLSESEARGFFKQLVDGMNYCHKNNVLHRDLKLENLLLTDNDTNQIKIIDFGISGASTSSGVNPDQIEIGSLHYLSPEAFMGNASAITPQTDVWAMGVILYGMLCGTLPFNGPTNKDIINQIKECKYSFPPEIEKELSIEVKDLLSKIFVPDYKKRLNVIGVMNHHWTKGLPLSMGIEEESGESGGSDEEEEKSDTKKHKKTAVKQIKQKIKCSTPGGMVAKKNLASTLDKDKIKNMSIQQKSDYILKQNKAEMARKSVQLDQDQLPHSLSPQKRQSVAVPNISSFGLKNGLDKIDIQNAENKPKSKSVFQKQK